MRIEEILAPNLREAVTRAYHTWWFIGAWRMNLA
jgi:hypothetical protein